LVGAGGPSTAFVKENPADESNDQSSTLTKAKNEPFILFICFIIFIVEHTEFYSNGKRTKDANNRSRKQRQRAEGNQENHT